MKRKLRKDEWKKGNQIQDECCQPWDLPSPTESKNYSSKWRNEWEESIKLIYKDTNWQTMWQGTAGHHTTNRSDSVTSVCATVSSNSGSLSVTESVSL